MLSPELSTGAVLVALAISIVSLIAAYGSFHFCMKVAQSERDLRHIVLALQAVDDGLAALEASHKKLRSRVGMRELREKRKVEANGLDGDDEPTDAEKWKREMRLKLHRGELKP